ncbi:succinylglutamate desuccinylase [Photobacterium japonica]|uniref:succinylglutamate desuccinylase n=1 Tax=Photobacterium japonica TaxID=2910235 RepID=UPI003D139889
MGMLERVKAGAFLAASLDMDSPEERGQWQTTKGAECELLARGVLAISPSKSTGEQKAIVISAGIHGDETAPMELVQHLAEQLLTGDLHPAHRLLLIIGHPAAIGCHQRFIDENMNRLFKQPNPATTPDAQRANTLQSVLRDFYATAPLNASQRWHLDLHCAIRDSVHYTFAVSPHSEQPTRSVPLFAFLQKAEIEAVLLANSPSPTFSWFSAAYFGAQAFTLELGKVAPFGKNDLARLAPFYQALVALVTTPAMDVTWQANALAVYKVTRTLVKQSDDFTFSFPDDQANFTFFEQGALLGKDGDIEYYSLDGGEAIVFPNASVALGQRAGLLVQQTDVNVTDQVTVK